MKNRFFIARDKDGDLYIYDELPVKMNDKSEMYESLKGGWTTQLNSDFFPQITFEGGPKELIIKDIEN